LTLFLQLDAGKKLQQLHRRQLQLQHSVVVVQVQLFVPFFYLCLQLLADDSKVFVLL